MVITKLAFGEKNKVRVFIEEEFAFLLYTSDIKKYHLKENETIEQEKYNLIIKETVFRRAKQKAIAILNRMDKTEYELRQKLQQGEYTNPIIEDTIEYVKSYHYIDDRRYAENYIRYKGIKKSKKQIEMELYQKGISKNIIDEAFGQGMDDTEAIKRAIQKKTNDVSKLSWKERQTIAAYLYRKGFCSEDIKKHLNQIED